MSKWRQPARASKPLSVTTELYLAAFEREKDTSLPKKERRAARKLRQRLGDEIYEMKKRDRTPPPSDA